MENDQALKKGKFTGILALLASIFLLIAGIAYLNVPYVQKLIIFSEKYFNSFHEQPMPYFLFWSDMFIYAMLMIGVVYCFQFIDKRLNNGIFSLISILAIIGYMLMGLTYISRLYYMPNVTKAFLEGTVATRDTIVALGTMEFDKFIMSYGFAGIWFFTVAIFSIRYKLLNKLIILLSFVIGFGYILALSGYLIRERILTTTSSCMVICLPIWAIMVFMTLKKSILLSVNAKETHGEIV
jgi:hypothetical protein